MANAFEQKSLFLFLMIRKLLGGSFSQRAIEITNYGLSVARVERVGEEAKN